MVAFALKFKLQKNLIQIVKKTVLGTVYITMAINWI